MTDFLVGQVHFRETAPVAGCRRKLSHGSAGKHILIVSADIRDGVFGAVGTVDHIANFGDILCDCTGGCGSCFYSSFRLIRLRGVDLYGTGRTVPFHGEAYCLSDVPEFEIVVAVDVVAGQFNGLSVQSQLLVHFRKGRGHHASGVSNASSKQGHAAKQADNKTWNALFHWMLLLIFL